MTEKIININNYFDRIFVINLKKRPDRKDKMLKKLDKINITNYEFVEAIDGSVEPYVSMYNKKLRAGFFESPGAFGVLLSVLKILLYAKNKKYNKILILEDDAIFHNDFNNIFNKKVINLNSWKLLYLGTSMEKERIGIHRSNIDGIITSKGQITGAFGIGIDSSIFEELIYYINHSNKALDTGPLKLINLKYNKDVLIFYPYIIICHTEDSNIRDGISTIHSASKYGWNLDNF
jgi:GR25 family glycosyltransferase involved in LPS biosynthesis